LDLSDPGRLQYRQRPPGLSWFKIIAPKIDAFGNKTHPILGF
jgi:hypothetical protein